MTAKETAAKVNEAELLPELSFSQNQEDAGVGTVSSFSSWVVVLSSAIVLGKYAGRGVSYSLEIRDAVRTPTTTPPTADVVIQTGVHFAALWASSSCFASCLDDSRAVST